MTYFVGLKRTLWLTDKMRLCSLCNLKNILTIKPVLPCYQTFTFVLQTKGIIWEIFIEF